LHIWSNQDLVSETEGTTAAMLHILFWVLGVLGGVGLILAAGWGFHRFCIALEDRGYLYYRTRPRGGGGGMSGVLSELDRLTRPSVQHVVEVRDESRRKQNDAEGKEED
jgi:hypothetical protein